MVLLETQPWISFGVNRYRDSYIKEISSIDQATADLNAGLTYPEDTQRLAEKMADAMLKGGCPEISD